MNIPCTHCLTPNEVTLPPANPDGVVPTISIRCSACGNIFSPEAPAKKSYDSTKVEPPRRVPPPAAAYPHQPRSAPPQQPTYTVNQDGEIYQVQDLSAVQRWIVENRLTRDGKISTDGQWWDRLGDRPEFKSFFEMLERVHALESRPEPVPVIRNSLPPLKRADPEIIKPTPRRYEETKPFVEAKKDPFLPEAIEAPSLPEVSAQQSDFDFFPPATEEIPFDKPHTDEVSITASIAAQQEVSEPIFGYEDETPAPTLPAEIKNDETTASIYDEYPSFSDTDMPTEEELLVATDEEVDDHSVAFIDEDWPTEQMGMDDDLEWVSAKQKKQRIFLGIVLITLIGLTSKTYLNMQNDPPPTAATAAVEETVEDPIELIDGEEVNELVNEETNEVADIVVEANEPESTVPVAPQQPAQRASSPARTTQSPPARRAPVQETESADSFMSSGRESMAEGDYRSARIAFLDAVDIEPQNPEANHGLAYAAHRQDDIPFAMRYYCRALSLAQPGSALASDIQSSIDSLHLECEG